MIDVSEQVADDLDYQVGAADIEEFESENGRIPEGAIVLINTGRAPLYPDREAGGASSAQPERPLHSAN